MAISRNVRNQIRARCDYRCVYCGTHEVNTGGELEVEHFQPKSKGGSDELDNLLYCCSSCNRFKGAYWPTEGSLPLLNPLKEDMGQHIDVADSGSLLGLSKQGQFYIELLQLNRPQLIRARLVRVRYAELERLLESNQKLLVVAQQRVQWLEQELQRLQQEIKRLGG